MPDNVSPIKPDPATPSSGGGGGGGDERLREVEKNLAVLAEKVDGLERRLATKEDISKVAEKMDHLASKQDIAEVQVELNHKASREQLSNFRVWVMGIGISILTAIIVGGGGCAGEVVSRIVNLPTP